MSTRREFLWYIAGASGTMMLAACGRTADPLPTSLPRATVVITPTTTAIPPTLTSMPTGSAVSTQTPLVAQISTATPTSTRPPTKTPTPTLTLTPTSIPTETATLTPLVPLPSSTALPPTQSAIYLPSIGVANEAYPVQTAAPTTFAVATDPPSSSSNDERSRPVASETPTRPTSTSIPATEIPTPRPCLDPVAPPPETAPPWFGLHASADPVITNEERCLFLDLRPSIIKVMTFHPPKDIGHLAASQPSATWIVRTFLSFGGRAVTPDQFVEWTLSDTRRTLDVLAGRDLVVELHNEPNLVAEGLQSAWSDGVQFNRWWLDLLATYRAALPGVRFLFPGVSPGDDVPNVRQNSAAFLEQCRPAIEAADGLALHLYWSDVYPQSAALAVLDDVIAQFPNKPIWITEASYNKGEINDQNRANNYLQFRNALRSRPTVQGVTFFVASASNPQFANETWIGREMSTLLGARQ